MQPGLSAVKRMSEDALPMHSKRANDGSVSITGGVLCIPLVKCPVCMDELPPPLMQCGGGHLICGPCVEKVNARGICPCAKDLD